MAAATVGEVVLKVAGIPGDGVAVAIEFLKHLEDLLEAFGADLFVFAALKIAEEDIVGPERNQDLAELAVVLHILLFFPPGDLVKRRLGDVDITALHQLEHLTAEEGQKEGPDVGSIDVSIGHDDDLVVADLFDFESPFLIPVADAGADRGDHRLDLLVLENLVETGLFHVDELTADRQDRLSATVAALLGGAAGGVTLDDVKFALGGVAGRAVGQFSGETAAGHGRLAHRVAGPPCRFAGAGGVEDFLDHFLGERGVLFEKLRKSLVNDGADDTLDLVVDELFLRLRAEAGVRMFHRNDRDNSFAAIFSGDRGILVLEQFVCLGVVIKGTGQRGAEAGKVRPAVTIRNRVGKTEHILVIVTGVLQHDIGVALVFGGLAVVIDLDHALAAEADGLFVDEFLVFTKLADEFDDSVFVVKFLLLP